MNRLGNEAHELHENDIEKYLNEALPELNIRLWIDMYGEEIEDRETSDTNMSTVVDAVSHVHNVLWLESITLTSYTPHNAPCSIKSSAPINTTHHDNGRFINRLMGKLAFKLPVALKKYKKERR